MKKFIIGSIICLTWNIDHTKVISIYPATYYCESCGVVTHVRNKRSGEQVILFKIIKDVKYKDAIVNF